ncbi:MAG: tetratricopeptide repeat protein [Pseudomonadota bacterium]
MKPYRIAILITAAIMFSSCAQELQREVDEQGKAITILQQKTQELDKSMRRLQADYHSELDRTSVELQSMKTRIDETSHRADKTLSDLNTRLNKLPVSAGEGQQQTEGFAQEGAGGDMPIREVPASQPAPQVPKPSGEKEMYNQAYSFFSSGEFEKSRKMFLEFLKVHPGSGLTDNAMYWIANTYFKEKKFEEAISACDDVIKKFPQGNKISDAYYLQALAFCEIKDPLTAQILLETLIQNFPNTEAAAHGKKKYEELKGKSAQ